MRAFHVMKGLVFFYNVKMLIFSIKWGGGMNPLQVTIKNMRSTVFMIEVCFYSNALGRSPCN